VRTDDHWLELHIGLRDHPKTARLRRRLGVSLPAVIGNLVLLWSWAIRYAPNGDLSRFDPDVIADAAGWDDDPGQLVRALIAAGFLDEDLRIHDWEAYAGRLLDRREANARRMREAREKARVATNGKEPDETRAAHATGARAAHVQGLPDLTGPDLTGPDRTPPPDPLRTAEGAHGLTEATDEDRELWERAREAASEGMLPANAERLAALEPLGRASGGGLHLRAPPEHGDLQRFLGAVRAALSQAGDAAGTHAQIVKG
jgi:hypothetical protein